MWVVSINDGKFTGRFIVIGLIAIILVQNTFADQAAATSESKSSESATSKINAESKSAKAIIVVAQKPSSSYDPEKLPSSYDTEKPNWHDWAGVPENSTMWLPTPKTTPLTLEEQEKRIVAQMQRSKGAKSVSGTQPPQPSHYTKGAKKQKKPIKQSGSSPLNFGQMDEIRGRVMNYGKMLFDFYMGDSNLEDLLPSGSNHHDHNHYDVGEGKANSGGWSSTQYHYSGHKEEKPQGKSLLKWLSRLIGVEGKSLGEFLREYQVHVLYDLVFTFFKWIFFLYAGLLIP